MDFSKEGSRISVGQGNGDGRGVSFRCGRSVGGSVVARVREGVRTGGVTVFGTGCQGLSSGKSGSGDNTLLESVSWDGTEVGSCSFSFCFFSSLEVSLNFQETGDPSTQLVSFRFRVSPLEVLYPTFTSPRIYRVVWGWFRLTDRSSDFGCSRCQSACYGGREGNLRHRRNFCDGDESGTEGMYTTGSYLDFGRVSFGCRDV